MTEFLNNLASLKDVGILVENELCIITIHLNKNVQAPFFSLAALTRINMSKATR